MQSAISKARTIPAHFYMCPEHFKEEIKKVFYRNWIHVGRLDLVQNKGDYFAGKVYRQPFIVTKSDEGVHAFDNVCRHHGTTLTRGSGSLPGNCITCPYHGWTYSLDGKLMRATRLKGIEDFRPKDYGLRTVPLETMGQLIFLNFGDKSENDNVKFSKIDTDFDKLKFVKSKTYNLNCNWKVFVDNYLDGGYHVSYAHKQLASNLDLKSYTTIVYDRHSVQSCVNKSELTSSNRVGSKPSTFTWIYPNLMLNRYGKWLDTNTVFPIDAERCQVVFDYYIEKDATDDVDHDLQESDQVQLEDELLCEKVQEGMHSKFYNQGRYAPNVEMAMYHFHDLLLKDLNMTVVGC